MGWFIGIVGFNYRNYRGLRVNRVHRFRSFVLIVRLGRGTVGLGCSSVLLLGHSSPSCSGGAKKMSRSDLGTFRLPSVAVFASSACIFRYTRGPLTVSGHWHSMPCHSRFCSEYDDLHPISLNPKP